MKNATVALLALIASASVTLSSTALAGPSGLKVLDTIGIGGTGGWDYANIDAVNHKLYVTHATSLAVIDMVTKAVTKHLADANGAHIALPLEDGKTLLLTQGKANKASFIDALTSADLGDVATGAKPDGAIFDPATGKVLVLDNGGARLDVIDPVSKTLTGTLALEGAPEGYAVDGKGLLFTHFEDKNALAVIDTRTLTVKATWPISDCEGPTGLALVPDQRLLLSACDGKARITNADTGAEVALLPIGAHADGALYDPKAKLGYIPCGDGTLAVISFEGKPHLIDTIVTKVGARTGAVDPETGLIYLPFAQFGPPANPGERPTIMPDTFAVLVVGK